jgi:hypothetical protein
LTDEELAKYSWLLIAESQQIPDTVKPWFKELIKRLENTIDDGK